MCITSRSSIHGCGVLAVSYGVLLYDKMDATELHSLRVAVLNFPAHYGLPQPQLAPDRERSHEIEQPSPSLCTHVAWNKEQHVWSLVGDFLMKLKEQGIRIPATNLDQHEAIRALQMCGTCHLLLMYFDCCAHDYGCIHMH